MQIDFTDIIVALIAGLLSGGGVAWLTARETAAHKLSEAAGNLASSYGERLGSLERRMARQNRYVRYLLRGIKVLTDQIDRLGGAPDWTPRDIDVACPTEDVGG